MRGPFAGGRLNGKGGIVDHDFTLRGILPELRTTSIKMR
jgi:hypothetical protein